jgi:hypothetical protein
MRIGRIQRFVVLCPLLAILLHARGCCVTGTKCPGQYATQLQNATLLPIQDVGIQWDNNELPVHQEIGRLDSCVEEGTGPNFGFSPEPIPKSVTAHWQTSDGKEHSKIVEVSAHVPDLKHFSGKIVFKFLEDDVEVVPVPQWLEDRNARLGKSTIP